MKLVFGILALALFVNLCPGSLSAEMQPVLYPNKYLSQVGETQANKDIQSCSNDAAGHVHRSQEPGQGLKAGTRSAAKGALLGTIGGAIAGNTGRGAAAGAAIGATSSAMKGIRERGSNDPVFQRYVNACLEDKGYRVLEWK